MKAHPQELVDVIKTMFLAGLTPKIISQETGIGARLISKWASQRGWSQAVTVTKQTLEKRHNVSLARLTANDLASQSARIKDSLAATLEAQAAALARQPIKSAKELANTRERQGAAAVLKTMAETGKLVFDWGSDQPAGLVLIAELGREAPPPTIEIAAEVRPDDSKPTACSDSAAALTIPEAKPLNGN